MSWYSKIETLGLEGFLPRLLAAGQEKVDSAVYYWDNLNRNDREHIIFQYTIDGSGCFEADGEKNLLSKGKAFLARVPSATRYYYSLDIAGSWEFVYCCFSGGFAEQFYDDITAKYGHIYDIDEQSKIVRTILSLSRLHLSTVQSVQGAKIAFEILTTLIDSKTTIDANSEVSSVLVMAREIVRENLSIEMNVSTLADYCGISREHLSRLFKNHLDISPRQYIEKEKILQACELLKTTNYSCKVIASMCGFGSSSHFGRVFKRITAVSPRRYRLQPTSILIM